MQIKLSDYVFKYLKSIGVNTIFTLTGGGIMHLVDSLGRSGVKYVCCHHEQSAAIAAQAFDMYDEQLSVCLVTTGPGGTNALTGAAAAYVDSTPVIYMTGQVKRSDFASLRGVRQFGAQENDIISMAKPITKYASLVMEPEKIAYELEKSVYIATHGRKGPVWIDIPLDVQAAMIEEDTLEHYVPDMELGLMSDEELTEAAKNTANLISKAKRPMILLGQGVRASKAEAEVKAFIEKTKIPVLATWRVLNFMGTNDEGFFGSPGLQAPRYSNLLLQHCDFLLVLGSRLDNMITAFSEEHFAFRAKKVIVDIDRNEIDKLQMTEVTPVYADVKDFMKVLLENLAVTPNIDEWICGCREIKKRYPILSEVQVKPEKVDLYQVTECVSKYSKDDDVIVISSTSRCNTAGHIAFEHKKGQRTISSMGMGSMGFAIPSAVGAYYAAGERRVVVIEGDGSLQLNIQELETIAANKIDAKMFIFNNIGYAAITTMQDRNFDSFYVGSNEMSGLHMPNLEKIAYAYDIPYNKIDDATQIDEKVAEAFATDGPFICDIQGSLWFDEIPKCISSVDKATGKRVSAFLENPYPYLSEEEMQNISELLIK